MKILILILVLAFVIGANLHADAVQSLKGKAVGVLIEKPLIMSGKLRYADLISFDNSSKVYSGGFIAGSYHDIKREKSKYENNLGYYQYNKKFTIFIDPPRLASTQMPLITIVSNLDEFHDTGQYKITENKTIHNDIKAQVSKRTYSTARFVDEGCFNAIISWKNWQVILPDTIQYMTHDCDPKFTKINTIISEYQPITKHDLATSSKYKLDSFYDIVKKDCVQKRNACTEINNKAVTTTRDVR